MLKLSAIGGTESFLYYLSRYLKDSDITIMYKIGDSTQVNRLRQYARVIKWENKFETERIECDKIFLTALPWKEKFHGQLEQYPDELRLFWMKRPLA